MVANLNHHLRTNIRYHFLHDISRYFLLYFELSYDAQMFLSNATCKIRYFCMSYLHVTNLSDKVSLLSALDCYALLVCYTFLEIYRLVHVVFWYMDRPCLYEIIRNVNSRHCFTLSCLLNTLWGRILLPSTSSNRNILTAFDKHHWFIRNNKQSWWRAEYLIIL